jgi:hypothetical protein
MRAGSNFFDTGDKFNAGVVDAGENDTGEQLLLVTTTPAMNILPVSMTPVNKIGRYLI